MCLTKSSISSKIFINIQLITVFTEIKPVIRNEVREGRVLSPFSFNIVVDSVLRETDNSARVLMPGGIIRCVFNVRHLDNTGEICLPSHYLNETIRETCQVSMKYNCKYT